MPSSRSAAEPRESRTKRQVRCVLKGAQAPATPASRLPMTAQAASSEANDRSSLGSRASRISGAVSNRLPGAADRSEETGDVPVGRGAASGAARGRAALCEPAPPHEAMASTAGRATARVGRVRRAMTSSMRRPTTLSRCRWRRRMRRPSLRHRPRHHRRRARCRSPSRTERRDPRRARRPPSNAPRPASGSSDT